MAKIPFDIKFRPQIESGEYKVETFSGYPVTIYRWDFKDGEQTPIMGSYVFEDGKEHVGAWNKEGHFDLMSPNDLDLFIVTQEPEMTAFEKKVYAYCDGKTVGEELIKRIAKELLDYARKELIKEGTSKNEMGTMLYDAGFEDGKAEALKDLPRWRKCDKNTIYNTKFNLVEYGVGRFLMVEGYQIGVDSLEKLPGFND